jgi:hypothetical protein
MSTIGGRILGRGAAHTNHETLCTFGCVVEEHDRFYLPEKDNGRGEPWEALTTKDDLHGHLQRQIEDGN